jgi:cytochrome c oxidase cbb3-type subunit 1
MMWRAVDEYGSLAYSFIDTVIVLHPYYTIRGIGGLLYLIGFFMFAYNIYKTMSSRPVSADEMTNRSPMGA